MTVLTLAAALALGAALPALQQDTIRIGRPPAARDTVRPAPLPADTAGEFDASATRDLVGRVIRAGSVVPEALRDYRAEMRSA
ncbi:MAG TPA: hypothetical protein VFX98_13280, partial [Longimicrobiaceae bacterium]|nr:hypothetical protein [Longimicrobiaceae bacterium]